MENAVGHACMMARADYIDIKDLPPAVLAKADWNSLGEEDLLPMQEMEKRHALRVLKHTGGNKVRAAEILGIGRTTLYRLLEELEQKPVEVARGGAANGRQA
jgi:DNA-binding NtrC family response regulator